jgi:hypothetical protein
VHDRRRLRSGLDRRERAHALGGLDRGAGACRDVLPGIALVVDLGGAGAAGAGAAGVGAAGVGAAAAGAAVAAVDYVWNKYVNSKSVNLQAPDENYFDLALENDPQQIKNSSLEGGVFPHQPQPVRVFAATYNGGTNPVALTPVVGTAVAGAVAYNATRWGLKQAFGDPNHEVLNLDEKQFDLIYQ